MTSKIKKTVAALLALAALALGGSAIASAMNSDSGSGNQATVESENGPEGADDVGGAGEANDQNEAADQSEAGDQNEAVDQGEAVGAVASARAKAAAEASTGGTAGQVSAESADAPEKGDANDPSESVTPAGAAFEVDVTKGSKELKVYLGDQFQVLAVQQND